MKKDFEILYDEMKSCSSELSEVWNNAKEARKKSNQITIAIVIIVDILIGYYCLNQSSFMEFNKDNPFKVLFMIQSIGVADIFIFLFTRFLPFNKKIKQYKLKYKEDIVKKLISNFYDNVLYRPEQRLSEREYKEGEYKEYYNRFYSDDYIEATILNKYKFKMANLLVQEVTHHTDSKGRSHTTTTTKFSGLFLKIPLDKSIKCNVRITPNGRYYDKKTKLEMDSTEFEKYFDVNTTNRLVAMEILTHDVMELLINFNNQFGKKFDIFIKDNVIYMRVSVGAFFEGNLSNDEVIPEKITKEYYKVLDFVSTLSTEIINLIIKNEF